MATNPRYKNGSLRRKHREYFKAQGLPCHICKRPIDYSLPAGHPDSFVIDEIKPVSRWREWGYSSAAACAQDFNNLAPAHAKCNAKKGNKLMCALPAERAKERKPIRLDGQW